MAGNLSAFVYISRSVWESWLCVSAFVQGKHLFASTFLVFFPSPQLSEKANWNWICSYAAVCQTQNPKPNPKTPNDCCGCA